MNKKLENFSKFAKEIENRQYVNFLIPVWAWLFLTKDYFKYSITSNKVQAKESELTILSIAKNAEIFTVRNSQIISIDDIGIDKNNNLFPLILKMTWGNQDKTMLLGNSSDNGIIWFYAANAEDEKLFLIYNKDLSQS